MASLPFDIVSPSLSILFDVDGLFAIRQKNRDSKKSVDDKIFDINIEPVFCPQIERSNTFVTQLLMSRLLYGSMRESFKKEV